MPKRPRSAYQPKPPATVLEPPVHRSGEIAAVTGAEILHIRCVLCGLQGRLSPNPPTRPDLPRLEDGPYEPAVSLQTIGGSEKKQGPGYRVQGTSVWKELGPPDETQLALLRKQLRAACELVGGIL